MRKDTQTQLFSYVFTGFPVFLSSMYAQFGQTCSDCEALTQSNCSDKDQQIKALSSEVNQQLSVESSIIVCITVCLCVCSVEGVAAGDWRVILTQTNSCVPVLGPVLFLFFFFLQISTHFFQSVLSGSLEEFGEHLLNDPEWCSRGSMWAAGVQATGAGAAELHSTSLGPRTPELEPH